jgi:hypothetical protein
MYGQYILYILYILCTLYSTLYTLYLECVEHTQSSVVSTVLRIGICCIGALREEVFCKSIEEVVICHRRGGFK